MGIQMSLRIPPNILSACVLSLQAHSDAKCEVSFLLGCPLSLSAVRCRFYNLVLYPRIRDDIAEYKRLNFHLYMVSERWRGRGGSGEGG